MESVTVTTVMMSGAVTVITITTTTSVATVVGACLLFGFVITIQTVSIMMMRVTVVMLQHVML